MSLSWRVQNIVVIGRIYLKLERSDFSSNFEFDRNMLSGTGARYALIQKSCMCNLSPDIVMSMTQMNYKNYISCWSFWYKVHWNQRYRYSYSYHRIWNRFAVSSMKWNKHVPIKSYYTVVTRDEFQTNCAEYLRQSYWQWKSIRSSSPSWP